MSELLPIRPCSSCGYPMRSPHEVPLCGDCREYGPPQNVSRSTGRRVLLPYHWEFELDEAGNVQRTWEVPGVFRPPAQGVA